MSVNRSCQTLSSSVITEMLILQEAVQTSKFREFMSPAIIVYYLNDSRKSDLQIMTKTSVKFQKNRHKTVGGVAHTRYPVSINFDSKNARKMPKLK